MPSQDMRFFEATMHHLGELMREQIAIHVTEKPFSKKNVNTVQM